MTFLLTIKTFLVNKPAFLKVTGSLNINNNFIYRYFSCLEPFIDLNLRWTGFPKLLVTDAFSNADLIAAVYSHAEYRKSAHQKTFSKLVQ